MTEKRKRGRPRQFYDTKKHRREYMRDYRSKQRKIRKEMYDALAKEAEELARTGLWKGEGNKDDRPRD